MNQAMRVETFPLSRVGTFDVGVIGGRKHQIVGLLEADVTAARRRLRALRREGAGGSVTAWVVKTVANTVEAMPQVHGVRLGRRRRVVFEDVDVAVIVERVVEGVSVPLPVFFGDRGRERKRWAPSSSPRSHRISASPGG